MATETYVVSSSGKRTIKKDPNDVLDYTWDWTDWLDLVSDTISSATFIPESPVTEVTKTIDATNKKVIGVFSGGTAGEKHLVTCRIVTVGARTADRSITLKMLER